MVVDRNWSLCAVFLPRLTWRRSGKIPALSFAGKPDGNLSFSRPVYQDLAFHRKVDKLPAWSIPIVFIVCLSSFPLFLCTFPPLPCFVSCRSAPLLKHCFNSVTSGCKLDIQSWHFRGRNKGKHVMLCMVGRDTMEMGIKQPDLLEQALRLLTKWAIPQQGVPNVTGPPDTRSSPLKIGPTWEYSLRVIPQVGGSSFCSGLLCFVWVLYIELRTLHMLNMYSTTEPHPQPHGFNIFSVLWICNRDTYFSKLICFE